MLKKLVYMVIIIVVMVRVLRNVDKKVVVSVNSRFRWILDFMFSRMWVKVQRRRFFRKKMFVIMKINSSSIFRLFLILCRMVFGEVRLISRVLIVSRLFGCSGQYFSVMVSVKMNFVSNSQFVVVLFRVQVISGLISKNIMMVYLYQVGVCFRKF